VLVQINDEIVYQEQVPTRGFLSSVDNKLILGLDTIQTVDKLTVIWPNGFVQDLKDVTSNQILTLVQEDAIVKFDYKNQKEASPGMFQDITDMVGINFTHVENNFNDYEREYLIPHNLSTQGPKMAVGDVNGDGLSDLYIGGARNQSSGIFIQNSEGSFERTAQPSINLDKLNEDVDAAFFDADGDGDVGNARRPRRIGAVGIVVQRPAPSSEAAMLLEPGGRRTAGRARRGDADVSPGVACRPTRRYRGTGPPAVPRRRRCRRGRHERGRRGGHRLLPVRER